MTSTKPNAFKTIFHIGQPKTGTTFLQSQIFGAIDCIYASASWDDVRDRVRRREAVAREEVFGTQDSSKTALLSHESIVAVNPKSVARFAKSIAENPVILLVVRNPDVWVRSYYLQQVHRKGESLRFDAWYAAHKTFLQKRMNYDDLYNTYVKFLGEDHVVFLPYEMMRDDPDRFQQALSQAMGVEIPELSKDSGLVNQSLDLHEAEMLRKVNSLLGKIGLEHVARNRGRGLRRAIGQLVNYKKEGIIVRYLRRVQQPIFRTDWERSEHLPEIWGGSQFLDHMPWGEDYGSQYGR